MKELFKERIYYIYMSEDKVYLAFIGSYQKVFLYEADGNCCSNSWFESITNPENIIGEDIIGIEEKKAWIDESDKDRDVIVVYGYTLKTHKGYTDIEFRNESNGYYGGSCEYISPDQIKVDTTILKELSRKKESIVIERCGKKIELHYFTGQ